jgi:hypothetical protein
MTRALWPFGGGKPTGPGPARAPEPGDPLGPAIEQLAKLNADEQRYGVDLALVMHRARRAKRKP